MIVLALAVTAAPADAAGKPKKKSAAADVPETSVTNHTISVDGTELKYSATAGYVPLKSDEGKTKARMFYVAYEKKDADAAERPVTFCFNGGPGASSIWLHMAALGPRYVPFPDQGRTLPDHPKLETNPHTWLTFTDLVFIDPVGTGYSRAADGVDPKQYWSLEGDLRSVAEFIRLYIGENNRWTSPLYVAGESYGATRAGGLAKYLQDEHDLYLDGLVLISSALDFQLLGFNRGTGITNALYLPTMTASARYHGKLPDDLPRDLPDLLSEVEKWAMDAYLPALAKGDELSQDRKKAVARTLSDYTGLPTEDIMEHDLRIGEHYFAKNLLRDQSLKLGLYDARVTAPAIHPEKRSYAGYDPSSFLTKGPLKRRFQAYVASELNWKTDRRYVTLSGKANHQWDWGQKMGFPQVVADIRTAMMRDPHLQVLVACGYYDLVTAYGTSEWVVRHLDLAESIRDNVRVEHYRGGHMMYTNPRAHRNLADDAEAVIAPQE
jgi:carboxypeptidase C (cathepsin A)